MEKREFHIPDESRMELLLRRHSGDLTGTVLRLLWRTGLTREEVAELTWDQADLAGGALRLPGRTVPLDGDTAACLAKWQRVCAGFSPWVAVSLLRRGRIRRESISRMVRMALDSVNLTEVRLSDLRHACILRQLQTLGWADTARITGMKPETLRKRYGRLSGLPEQPRKRENAPEDDAEARLTALMEQEQDSLAGLVLCLSYELGLSGREMLALRWDMLDLEQGTLRQGDRTLELPEAALGLLRRRREEAPAQTGTGAVLQAGKAGGTLDLPQLSRLLREALVRGGLEQLGLRQIRGLHRSGGGERELLERVRTAGSVTRREAETLLSFSQGEAQRLLRRMVSVGQLVRVGGRYYAAERVRRPGDLQGAVLEFLSEAGESYRQGIAEYLGIESRQVSLLLRRMVAEGLIRCENQRYYVLKQAEE